MYKFFETVTRRKMSTLVTTYAEEMASAGKEVAQQFGKTLISGKMRIFNPTLKPGEKKAEVIARAKIEEALKNKSSVTPDDIKLNAQESAISLRHKSGW